LDPEIKESPKVDELIHILNDIFEESPDRKILVFSEWVRMLDLVAERLDKKRIDYVLHTGSVPQAQRRVHINRFKNDPNCRIFLSSDSGGLGLNLQAASVVINLDLPWNPAKLEQRIARAWRKMQRNAVHVVNIIASNSIEERMLATLGFKQGLSDYVLDARGDQNDFEQTNAKSAFIARLTDVIGKSLAPSQTPPSDPVKVLSDELSLSNLGISQLRMTAPGTGSESAFLAVGNEMSEGFVHAKIKKSFGSDVPAERLTLLTPETYELLKKLEAQGFIQFVSEGTKSVYTSEPREAPQTLRKAALLKLAHKPLSEAQRSLKMATLLSEGGFAEEAAAPAIKAILRAATALHALTLEGQPDSVPDITTVPNAITRLSESLTGPNALLLQLCLTGIPDGSGNLVMEASAFVDQVETHLSAEALKP
ncbi:MAG: C-terminal helicase domain-containing protein, partial [Salinivirgaceae bacterium]|nr:C-terminal helicase domain-containing protein [Salinivirgaceae bacterium]